MNDGWRRNQPPTTGQIHRFVCIKLKGIGGHGWMAGERSNGIRPEPFLWLGRIGQRHFGHPITLFICHFDPCRPPSTLISTARESSSLAHIEFPHEQNDMRYRDRVRSIQGYYYTWPSIIIIITTVEHEYWGVWPSKQMRRAEREYSAVWKSFCVQGSPCSSTTTTTTTDETERTHKIKVIKMLNLFSSSHTHTHTRKQFKQM